MLPRIPNQFLPVDKSQDPLDPVSGGRFEQDDSTRMRRLIDEDDSDSPFWKWIFAIGWVLLAAFGILAWMGWPGSGLILVPIGMGLVIGGGISCC